MRSLYPLKQWTGTRPRNGMLSAGNNTKLGAWTRRRIGAHVDVLDFIKATITADAAHHHHIRTSTLAPVVEEVRRSEVFVDGDAAVSPQS